MAQDNSESRSLLGGETHSIVLVDRIDNEVDAMFITRVETPEYDHGLLFPVVAQENRGFPGNWMICPMDGFAHIPYVPQRMDILTKQAEENGDSVSSLMGGMMKKNNYSVESLVRACDISPFWKNEIYGALNDFMTKMSVMHYIDYPAAHKEHSVTLNKLLFLSHKQRQEVSLLVDDYVLNYARWQNRATGDNSKGRRDSLLRAVEFSRQELNNVIDPILPDTIPNEAHDDNGNLYLKPPVLWT